MATRKELFIALFSFCLAATLFVVLPSRSATNPYDPWGDVSGPTLGVPDGTINMRDINYLIQRFNTFGTPIDRSSLMSIAYDSGWLNITDKCGQNIVITHNLNSTDLIVDVQGKTTLDSEPHQKHYGLTGHMQGWNKTYGGTGYDKAYALVQTGDGGYALAGGGLANLIKTDASGNMQWNRTYGGTGYDEAYALVQTADGGYALVGDTDSFGAGYSDFWLVKTDASGIVQCNKTYGGAADDYPWDLVQTADGGYALVGWTASFGAGNNDFWLVKTDVESGLAWVNSTADTVTLYRGETDPNWNFVRVRIWKPTTP